ncbi:MAG: polymer-forming cytoskeletal protein, partial [Lentisphaerae bacterium]|nr:polymer-forming cytoskeletal protein [Lentisphaerota bacterium]
KKKKGGHGNDASRIGKTIVPMRFEIICYECEYVFVLTGHIHETMCPRCHHMLTVSNKTIHGEWSGTDKTIGSIEIAEDAVLKNTTLIGGDIIIAGDARDADIRATRKLELRSKAQFDMTRIIAKDLLIGNGSRFSLARPLNCRNLDVQGELKATISASGAVFIRNSGFFRGELHCRSLVIEEGGRMKAKTVLGSFTGTNEEQTLMI